MGIQVVVRVKLVEPVKLFGLVVWVVNMEFFIVVANFDAVVVAPGNKTVVAPLAVVPPAVVVEDDSVVVIVVVAYRDVRGEEVVKTEVASCVSVELKSIVVDERCDVFAVGEYTVTPSDWLKLLYLDLNELFEIH